MIALAFLAGGAVFLGLRVWASADVTLALAAGLLVLIVGLSLLDVTQGARDRRTAYRRWREWDL